MKDGENVDLKKYIKKKNENKIIRCGNMKFNKGTKIKKE